MSGQEDSTQRTLTGEAKVDPFKRLPDADKPGGPSKELIHAVRVLVKVKNRMLL